MADKKVECDAIRDELKNVEGEAGDKKLQKASLGAAIKSAERQIGEDEARIVEIRK